MSVSFSGKVLSTVGGNIVRHSSQDLHHIDAIVTLYSTLYAGRTYTCRLCAHHSRGVFVRRCVPMAWPRPLWWPHNLHTSEDPRRASVVDGERDLLPRLLYSLIV